MKAAFLFIVFCLQLPVLFAQNVLTDYNLDKGSFAITCISLDDCVNCYYGYNKVVSYLDTHPDLNRIIVLKDISKNDIDYFLSKRFNIDRKKNKVIVDERLFNSLCPSAASSFVILRQSTKFFSSSLKLLPEVTLPDLKEVKEVLLPVDSIDVSDIMGKETYNFKVLNDSIIVLLNTVRNAVELFNLNQKKVISSFPKQGREEDFTDMLYKNDKLTNVQIKLNKENFSPESRARTSYSLPEYLFDNLAINDDKIILAVDISMAAYLKRPGSEEPDTTNLGITREPAFVFLNKDLSLNNIMRFPVKVPGHPKLYNWIHYFNIEENRLFISISNSSLNDSLVAMYQIVNDSAVFKTILPVKLPAYFPLHTSQGLSVFYPSNCMQIKNHLYYSFNREPVLHTIPIDTMVYLAGWNFTAQDTSFNPDIFVNTICINNSKVVATGFNKAFYLFIYSESDFYLRDKILISNRRPLSQDYAEGRLYCLYRQNGTYMLYCYKVK